MAGTMAGTGGRKSRKSGMNVHVNYANDNDDDDDDDYELDSRGSDDFDDDDGDRHMLPLLGQNRQSQMMVTVGGGF